MRSLRSLFLRRLLGFYPDNIGYLIENYDLHIDKNSCIVHYSPVSSNIMPDIKVIAK